MNRKFTALEWLGHLHYQICNGGLAQACMNGYVDDLIEAYGSFDGWVADLKQQLGNASDTSRKALAAARLISEGVSRVSLSKPCPDCDGSGYLTYEEEDDEGNPITTEETCRECNGSGILDVDRYEDVDFEYFGVDNFDSEYYDSVDSDAIDDLTNQSHNHSVVLDMLERAS